MVSSETDHDLEQDLGDDIPNEAGFSMQQFLSSFIVGFSVAVLIWITFPVDEWRVSQVVRAYVTLNWTHTREVSFLQDMLYSFQLPFTLADSREQAALQHMVSGIMGAYIPFAVGCLQGRPHNLAILSNISLGRKRTTRPTNEMTSIDCD